MFSFHICPAYGYSNGPLCAGEHALLAPCYVQHLAQVMSTDEQWWEASVSSIDDEHRPTIRSREAGRLKTDQ